MSKKYDFYDLQKVEELAGRPEVIEQDGYYWDPTDLPPKEYLDSEVPQEYKDLAMWFRSKMNGEQVRELLGRLSEMFGINFWKLMTQTGIMVDRQNVVENISGRALSTANEADAKSDSALSLANSANTKSNSVQSQLSQLVIDGDSSVESAQARVDIAGITYPTLKDRMDASQRNPRTYTSPETEKVELGENLILGNWKSNGWTGNPTAGFTNTAGNTLPLEVDITEGTITNLYRIELTATDVGKQSGGTSDFYITLGGSAPFETYKGTFDSVVYTFGINKPSTNNKLVITPTAGWTGSISGVTVKNITLFTQPAMSVYDSNNQLVTQARFGPVGLDNLFIGENSGRMNVDGEQNTSLGQGAMDFNTTGFWNVALGYEALKNNTVGTRNVAIGRIALTNNISGDRNVAVGSWALMRNRTGRSNIGIGADAAYYLESGDMNIAIGLVALGGNRDGNNHIAIGERTMAGGSGGEHNIAMGSLSLFYNNTKHNVSIGQMGQYQNRTGNYNLSLGAHSLYMNQAGHNNTAIGFSALRNNTNPQNSIAIGQEAMIDSVNGDRNIAMGHHALRYINGERNIAIGAQSGNREGATGDFNTFLGSNSAPNHSEGDRNIIIGFNVYKRLANGSDEINIGDTILGDQSTKVVELQKLALTDLPTTQPTQPNIVWNDGGTLKVS